MANVTYQLADAYASSGITGATVGYGNQQTFDVLAALKGGGGDSVGRGGQFTVTDPTLIGALDSDPAVKRTGAPGPPPGPSAAQAGQAFICIADGNGKYPARPGVQTPVIWVGPNSPGSFAQDNDLWFNSTSTITA